MVSSCSSRVARYADSMIISVLAMSRSSPCADHEGVVRRLGELPEVPRRAAAHALDRLARSALVHAETAVHPVDLAAALLCLGHHRADPEMRHRMVLLREVVAVDGVRVCR